MDLTTSGETWVGSYLVHGEEQQGAVDDGSSGRGGGGAARHGFWTLALHYRALTIQFRLNVVTNSLGFKQFT